MSDDEPSWKKQQRRNQEEIAKHLQGKPSAVQNGMIDGHLVRGLSGGGAVYNGNVIDVQHGRLRINGSDQRKAP